MCGRPRGAPVRRVRWPTNEYEYDGVWNDACARKLSVFPTTTGAPPHEFHAYINRQDGTRVCMQSLIPEPKDSCRNDPHGAVALSPFVVAGCQGTELLAAGDEVLHPMAAAVELAVERPMSRLPL